jgi:tetratricopeptide (TPR) repeat protein
MAQRNRSANLKSAQTLSLAHPDAAGVLSSLSRPGSSPGSAGNRLIRSCIVLLYLLGCVGLASAEAEPEADRLYADRANLESAWRAADLWRAELARNPGAFEAAWKLARADYWLGGHAAESERRTPPEEIAHLHVHAPGNQFTESERRTLLEEGIAAGEKAAALQPNRPEGHFWMAANMGMLAESFGIRAGLKYRKPIKEALETVLRLDPAFQHGAADRALGGWYFKVPGLLGGSNTLAEEHLRASLKYNPNNTASRYLLAEVLLDDDRNSEARDELRAVIDAPLDPDWTPEDQEFKDKARKLLSIQ